MSVSPGTRRVGVKEAWHHLNKLGGKSKAECTRSGIYDHSALHYPKLLRRYEAWNPTVRSAIAYVT
jgi:hypothetical protein